MSSLSSFGLVGNQRSSDYVPILPPNSLRTLSISPTIDCLLVHVRHLCEAAVGFSINAIDGQSNNLRRLGDALSFQLRQ